MNIVKHYYRRLVLLETDRGKAVEELVEYFEGKIKDKNSALEQVKFLVSISVCYNYTK